jgi:predicted flap endonuclease-1-like 5' DNA nuclease
MTELLEQAIAKLKTRSISKQDSIAALILEELHADEDLGFSADQFRESWKQATAGNTLPLSQLWESSEVG